MLCPWRHGAEMALPFHCLSTCHLCPQWQQTVATGVLAFPPSYSSVTACSSFCDCWREVFSRKTSTYYFWDAFSHTSVLRILKGVHIVSFVFKTASKSVPGIWHTVQNTDYLGTKLTVQKPITLQLAFSWPLTTLIRRYDRAILTFPFPFLR